MRKNILNEINFLRKDVIGIIDCKISLENPVNFSERRMLDFS